MFARNAGMSSDSAMRKDTEQKENDNKANQGLMSQSSTDHSDVELVGTNPQQRNWRGILIAILVILIVLSLIVVAVILVSPKNEDVNPGDPFTLEDFLSNEYNPRYFNSQWLNGKPTFVYRSREAEIMAHKIEENDTLLIMDNSTFRELNTDVYFVSEDLQYVLIAYDIIPIYRHSFLAKYVIYNRKAKNTKEKLVPFPMGVSPDDWKGLRLQYAGWSQTGSSLTFVYENNLYYQADPFTTTTKLTQDGQLGSMYNGITDWLYEEEILHSTSAHWWAPGSTSLIVYAKFNDTAVPKYRFPYYGPGTNIYGDWSEVAYPKAGDKDSGINPVVSVWVVDASRGSTPKELVAPTSTIGKVDYYLTSVVWQNINSVLVVWTNRAQNKTVVMHCEVASAQCTQNLEESSHGRGWVTLTTPKIIEDGNSYLTILPNRDGKYGYWKHIALVPAQSRQSSSKSFVTQGLYDVTEVVGYRQDTATVYFISTDGAPETRHLFEVQIPDGTYMLHKPRCMTCHYSPQCSWFSAMFSSDGFYYMLYCQGPQVPWFALKSTIDDREVMLEDNAELKSKLENKAQPTKEYMKVELPSGEAILAQVLIPPKVNREQIIKYPMLVNTYGGPGTQRVTDQFSLGFDTYLTTTENVIYVLIDGRGSGGRGDEWLHSIYRNLGTYEVEDQITAARAIRDNLHFVDENRVAIWGWSYGGFVTAHAIGHEDNDVFSCGIAVAPVTDFRYYDTAYTERYMGLANSNDNYKGYDNANVANKAANFRGKHFMVVHGTADDNVHFQHSAQLTKALTEAEVEFRSQVYSDQSHALAGPKTSRHLYRSIIHFLKQECWEGGLPHKDGKPEAQEY